RKGPSAFPRRAQGYGVALALFDGEGVGFGADIGVVFTQRRHRTLHARVLQRRVDAHEPVEAFRRTAVHPLERLEWILRSRIVAQLHARILFDARERTRPRHRHREAAEMIDQPALKRLLPGPHPALRHRPRLFTGHAAAFGDDAEELLIGAV